jgi:hypothetical protein
VQGLKSAKEVWDVLKTAHEGDELTKITKREMIEGELGRFPLRQGEEPQDMYNRLKTLVNQVRNLGSKKWDDHEVVKVILRSLIFLNPTQVQLIRGNPRYTLMTPEEVIGNFVSFEFMIKGSRKINELDGPSMSEAQPVAFKATEEKKEESTPSRTPIDASKLDNEEMVLVIKSFRQILKQRRGKDYKPRSKKVCYKCGKPGHFIAKCPISSDSDRGDDKKGRRKEKKSTTRRRAAMPMFVASGTPTKALVNPPTTRTPPTSPSPKGFSSPTSATSASWQRTAKRRRLNPNPPLDMSLLAMIMLVMRKIICVLFLPT